MRPVFVCEKKNMLPTSLIQAVFFILLFLLALTGTARGKTPNLIFVVDASGSMELRINNQMKMEMVKDALADMIRLLPDRMNAGLVTYGHRRKGDCKDAEELIPLGPLDKEGFIGRLGQIRPTGMTSIALSVEKAAQKFKPLKNRKNILLLIADGQDSCMGDPCGLVSDMKDRGIRFVTHVVALDVKGKAEEQLACIAKAGKGLFFSVRDIQELKQAVRSAIEKSNIPIARTPETLKKQKPVSPGSSEKPEIRQPGRSDKSEIPIARTPETLKKQKPVSEIPLISKKPSSGFSEKSDKSEIPIVRTPETVKKQEPVSKVKKKISLISKKPAPSSEKPEIRKTGRPGKSAASASPEKRLRLKVNSGLVRHGPSPKYKVIFGLKKGDAVSVTETKEDWYHIRLGDGRTGWAYQGLFSEITPKEGARDADRIREIRDIRVERISDQEERIIFTQKGLNPPEIFFLEENVPKIVCDFSETRLAGDVSRNISIKGKLIQNIRVGVHNKPKPRLRVVSDLVPGRKYKTDHMRSGKKDRYILIIRTIPESQTE